MSTAKGRPDLGRIGGEAFTDVLGALLALPAAPPMGSDRSALSTDPDAVTSSVPFAGPRLSGILHLRLPRLFVAKALQQLAGLEGDGREADDALLDDAAGELANQVAGRVAAQLAAMGFPCSLGTPSVTRDGDWPMEPGAGVESGRTELLCAGHRLSLGLHGRYLDP